MKVLFVHLGAQHRQVESELREAFERVLQRSSFILGPEVGRFEAAFSSYLHGKGCDALERVVPSVLESLQCPMTEVSKAAPQA